MIKELQIEDLPILIQLHIKVLPDTLNVSLGTEHLYDLYYDTLTSNLGTGFIEISDSGKLQGFILGTYDLISLQKLLEKKMNLLKKMRICLICLTKFHYFQELLCRIVNKKLDYSGGYILTLGVEERCLNKGIASKLVKVFSDTLKNKNITTLAVDTKINNSKANSFYLKQGFKFIKTYLGTNYYAKDI